LPVLIKHGVYESSARSEPHRFCTAPIAVSRPHSARPNYFFMTRLNLAAAYPMSPVTHAWGSRRRAGRASPFRRSVCRSTFWKNVVEAGNTPRTDPGRGLRRTWNDTTKSFVASFPEKRQHTPSAAGHRDYYASLGAGRSIKRSNSHDMQGDHRAPRKTDIVSRPRTVIRPDSHTRIGPINQSPVQGCSVALHPVRQVGQ